MPTKHQHFRCLSFKLSVELLVLWCLMASWTGQLLADSEPEVASRSLDSIETAVDSGGANSGETNAEPASVASTIEALIAQLGAPEYAEREQAETKLLNLGSIAYDALHAAAKDHEDIEIRLRSRHLMRLLRSRWIMEGNLPDVRDVLRGYSQLNAAKRKMRMAELMKLEDYRGVPALCKIAKFEESEELSEFAVLALVSEELDPDPSSVSGLLEAIDSELGTIERQSVQWLRNYVKTIRHYLTALSLRATGEDFAEEVVAAKEGMSSGPVRAEPHFSLAQWLDDHGLFAGAEHEYRETIRIAPNGSLYKLWPIYLATEMLHDQQLDRKAGDLLKQGADLLKTDPGFEKLSAGPLRRPIEETRSRMHYFYACDYLAMGNVEAHVNELEKGLESCPTDADVLIAALRAASTKEQQKRISELIDAAVKYFRERIAQAENNLQSAEDRDDKRDFERMLATEHNQLAWLVANSQGCFRDALASSQKSLELRPDEAGYLDTLSHCYFALEDFENAVKYQRRAVELEPHTGQIARALATFEKSLAQAKSAADEDAPSVPVLKVPVPKIIIPKSEAQDGR